MTRPAGSSGANERGEYWRQLEESSDRGVNAGIHDSVKWLNSTLVAIFAAYLCSGFRRCVAPNGLSIEMPGSRMNLGAAHFVWNRGCRAKPVRGGIFVATINRPRLELRRSDILTAGRNDVAPPGLEIMRRALVTKMPLLRS